MSSSQHPEATPANATVFVSHASVGDYFSLLKPRVMSLVVFTGAVGYALAPQELSPVLGMFALLALALGAGSAGAINMYYERGLDARMRRTAHRPLPQNKMHPSDALAFALILSTAALMMMWMTAGIVPASLLLFSIFFYAVVYTIWLKPSTPQNIVIGGAAGAFPPVIGWAAASGGLSWDALVLFAIIFFWTPPHFWALALFRQGDYAEVGLPMLPNTHGIATTKRHILVYTLLLFPLSLLPSFLGTVSLFYAPVAAICGGLFCWRAWCLMQATDDDLEAAARRMFGYSIVYLFMLFGVLLMDAILFGYIGIWS